jgi:hypothetical protein
MEIFETVAEMGHERVVLCSNPEVGLRAIIAVHSTVLGPGLGGLRMWPFKSDQEALTDVLRLSRGMTYKAAAAGLNLGGGKAVILGDSKVDKSEALFRAFGRYIESLNGLYITAEDVGTDMEDMELILTETRWVTGVSPARQPTDAFRASRPHSVSVLGSRISKDDRSQFRVSAALATTWPSTSRTKERRSLAVISTANRPTEPTPSSASRSSRPTRSWKSSATSLRHALWVRFSMRRRFPSCAAASLREQPTTSWPTSRETARSYIIAASCTRQTLLSTPAV